MAQSSLPDLCFESAHKQARQHHASRASSRDYTDEKFYHNLLKHFQGVRHLEDEKQPLEYIATSIPWSRACTVTAIRRAAIRDGYRPLSDEQMDILLRIFLACDLDFLAQVEIDIYSLESLSVPQSLFIQPLAVLAIDANSIECFRFCMKQGAQHDEDLNRALDEYFDVGRHRTVVGFLDVAHECDWRLIRSDQEKLSRFAGKMIKKRDMLCADADVLNWLIAHGATFTEQEIIQAGYMSVHEDAMAVLLDLDAPAIIRPPTVQAGVMNYQIGTVKLLLEAGAPVNTGKIGFAGIDYWMAEVGPMDQALIEVISPMWLKNPETVANLKKRVQLVRLLLEHGADVDDVGARGYTPRQLVFGAFKYTCPKVIANVFKEFGYGPEKVTKPES